ncbi:MAG: rRNA maturation RNase YbeY [Elusimicrobiota bacterium]
MNKDIVITISEKGPGEASSKAELISKELVRKAVIFTVGNFWRLSTNSPQKYILDIDFVSNKKILKINKKYLNRNRPTDVIAFSLEEGERIPSPEKPVIGQLIISVDRAQKQAVKIGHSVEIELLVLVIHGALHICGWSEGKEIQECQEKIKRKILKNRV